MRTSASPTFFYSRALGVGDGAISMLQDLGPCRWAVVADGWAEGEKVVFA